MGRPIEQAAVGDRFVRFVEAVRSEDGLISMLESAAMSWCLEGLPDALNRRIRTPSDSPAYVQRAMAMRLDEVELSARAYNVLQYLDCVTVGDVTRLTRAQLARSRGCGRATITEIELCLERLGLRLDMWWAVRAPTESER